MKNKKINISVMIPCYNEEKVLCRTIQTLEKFFYKYKSEFNYELIFVNDGSTDNTQNILNLFGNDKVKYYSSRKNIGKGDAVKKGLIKAKYNNIMLLDCDLSVRPVEILDICNLNNENSFVMKGQRVQVKSQPKHRLFAGWCFRLLTRVVLKLDIKDTQCPFWVFHNIDTKIFTSLKTKGFAFDCELLYKLKQNNITIIKKDVDYFNDENSSVTLWKTIKMFFELIKIRFL